MNQASPTQPRPQLDGPRRQSNNFDLLRLLAATCVVFAHSFDLLNVSEPFPHLPQITWGYVGVLIFFSISGFLVCQSWSRNPRLLPFAMKRLLRLIPGLFVALLLTALLLGPLATTMPVHVYLQNPQTKAYILNNVLMQSDYTLPGVFAHTAYPTAVNGSLWTLPLEVKAYVFIAIAGLVGLFTRWRLVLPALALLAILMCVDVVRRAMPVSNHIVASLVDIQLSPAVVEQVKGNVFNSYPDMFATFVIGATMYTYRRHVPLRWDFAGAAAVILVVAALIGGQAPELTAVVIGPYLVLCLAFLTTQYVHLPSRMGDYSYGLYVYAFPVQQTISQVMNPHSGWPMFVVAMPITLALAIGSWHLVERPALSLKARLSRPQPPAGTTPPEPAKTLLKAGA